MPGRPQKTTEVVKHRILSVVKKTSFRKSGQLSRKQGYHLKAFMNINTKGFISRCKPPVTLKKRNATLHFAKRHAQFIILQTDETTLKNQITRLMGRGVYREGKHRLTIQNIPHHLLNLVVMAVCVAASGTESLVINDYVTSNKSTKINSEVSRGVISALIQAKYLTVKR